MNVTDEGIDLTAAVEAAAKRAYGDAMRKQTMMRRAAMGQPYSFHEGIDGVAWEEVSASTKLAFRQAVVGIVTAAAQDIARQAFAIGNGWIPDAENPFEDRP